MNAAKLNADLDTVSSDSLNSLGKDLALCRTFQASS
jgi:hypothetical protein